MCSSTVSVLMPSLEEDMGRGGWGGAGLLGSWGVKPGIRTWPMTAAVAPRALLTGEDQSPLEILALEWASCPAGTTSPSWL